MTTPALPTHGLPPAEHPVDAALARALLAGQHPDLAGLPIARAAEGWDNVMFRLGDDLALRLPRRAVGAELIRAEQRWLPGLAATLPLPIPAPLRTGSPALGYPWPWSVTPWLPGLAAEQAPLRADQAARLGAFLKALHRPAPADAPFNPHRSVTLAERTATAPAMARVAAARPELIDETVRQAWRDGLAAALDLAPTWIHGDLHARNVLSEAGALSGIIDWGDMARGDPATDLYGLWMLLPDAAARAAALAAYGGVSAATLARARGWAVAMGVILVEAGGNDDPGLAAMGERTLKALRDRP
jgi:aminoglycoside phosphotransferase (APT) family kinase protein